MEIRRSYGHLISTMGFPILVRCHFYIDMAPRCLDSSMWGPFTVIQSSLCQVIILVLFIGPLIVGCQCTPQLRWSGKWPWGSPSNSIIFPRHGMGEDIVVYKHIFVCIGIFSIETYLQLHTLIIWSNIKQNWTHQESNSDRAWVRIWFNKIPLHRVFILVVWRNLH